METRTISNGFKENIMPNEHTSISPDVVHPYRCLAYKNEEGADVTDQIIIATNSQRARDLFVLEVGADKIKDGYEIQVFPMR